MIIGYARVSTDDQNLDAQTDALMAVGAGKLFADKISGSKRERISERTKEGLASARKRGRIGGRPPALSTAQRIEVRQMRDKEHRAVSEIARLFKVSERTVRRA